MASSAFAPLRPTFETRFARAELPSGIRLSGIIVLGGNWSRIGVGTDLAGRFPDIPLIITGAAPRELALLAHAELDPSRLVLEHAAQSTYDNAANLAIQLAPKRGERYLLVTSAIHMPRAAAAFAQAGFEVLAWPVVDAHPAPRYVGATIAHEIIALFVYRLLGRTASLWPSPASLAVATDASADAASR